jgi:hypothetical protein
MANHEETYSGDVSSFLSGTYYKKSDLEGSEDQLLLTIAGVEKVEFRDQKTGETETRLQLTFEGEDTKKLTLNVTNLKILVKHFGSKSSGWIGRRIVLYLDENVTFGSSLVGGLRVRVPRASKAAPLTTVAEAEDPDGSILF